MDTRRQAVGVIALAALLGLACDKPARAPVTLPPTSARFATVARAFAFKPLAVPAAKRTIASGVNDRGQIVGLYDDSIGSHGFLLRDGQFSTIDFPGAVFTAALGIGSRGEIVGAYKLPGEPMMNFHGFLRRADGRFERVDAPSHTNAIAQRILPDGTILGCLHDEDMGASMKGAVLTGRHHGETQAFASMHNGATPDLRRIVGLYNYAPDERSAAYVIDDGKFQPLVVPGSSATTAWDVNPAGEVVGSYRDSVGVHGFVLTANGFVALNAPNATMTRILGTNAAGDVVGSFTADGHTYGFVATPTRQVGQRP